MRLRSSFFVVRVRHGAWCAHANWESPECHIEVSPANEELWLTALVAVAASSLARGPHSLLERCR